MSTNPFGILGRLLGAEAIGDDDPSLPVVRPAKDEIVGTPFVIDDTGGEDAEPPAEPDMPPAADAEAAKFIPPTSPMPFPELGTWNLGGIVMASLRYVADTAIRSVGFNGGRPGVLGCLVIVEAGTVEVLGDNDSAAQGFTLPVSTVPVWLPLTVLRVRGTAATYNVLVIGTNAHAR